MCCISGFMHLNAPYRNICVSQANIADEVFVYNSTKQVEISKIIKIQKCITKEQMYVDLINDSLKETRIVACKDTKLLTNTKSIKIWDVREDDAFEFVGFYAGKLCKYKIKTLAYYTYFKPCIMYKIDTSFGNIIVNGLCVVNF